jgi:hypothetical protein
MIDLKIKKLFFDRKRITDAVDAARVRVLARAGGLVRTIARRSIRKRKDKVSLPGNPPFGHGAELLKRFIFFGYDPHADSVVIGPAKLNRSGDAPHLLEFGGTTTLKRAKTIRVGPQGRNRRGQFTRGERKRLKAGTRLRYQPRPFMGPALQKAAPKLPELWRNSVR